MTFLIFQGVRAPDVTDAVTLITRTYEEAILRHKNDADPSASAYVDVVRLFPSIISVGEEYRVLDDHLEGGGTSSAVPILAPPSGGIASGGAHITSSPSDTPVHASGPVSMLGLEDVDDGAGSGASGSPPTIMDYGQFVQNFPDADTVAKRSVPLPLDGPWEKGQAERVNKMLNDHALLTQVKCTFWVFTLSRCYT
jgi:hypothetical protein